MRFIKSSSENEMILEFIRAELQSNRFSDKVSKAISDTNANIDIIMKPDLYNDMENVLRKQILALYRGYGQNIRLFEAFPTVTKWNWESITKDDLNDIKYINYSYWNELSSGTSSPNVAAINIKNGIISCGVKNDGFFVAVDALKKGHKFSPMILLKDYNNRICIVLEGHLRLTAYALADYHMKDVFCIVGYCCKEDLLKWNGVNPV